MKFLCPACQSLAEIAAVRAEATRLFFACSVCGAETAQETPAAAPAPVRRTASGESMAVPQSSRTWSGERLAVGGGRVVPLRPAPALAPETAHDPFLIPAGHCPKCLAERSPTDEACRRCGLFFENTASVSFDPPEPIRALWSVLWGNWNNPGEHEQFRQAAFAHGELVHAGRLYQLRLARLPGDEHAERGRGEILRMVSTVASMERTPRPDTRRMRVISWSVVLLFLTSLAGVLVKFLLTR